MELYNTLFAMGSKEAGSPAGKNAGQFIYEYLRQHFPRGIVERESFQIHRQKPAGARLVFGDQGISAQLYENTGVEGSRVKGSIKFAGVWSFLFCSQSLAGKIIVVKQRALLHRLWLVKRAYEKGALAIIYVPDVSGHIPKGLGYPYIIGSCPMPAIGIQREDLQQLRRSGAVQVEIEYASVLEQDLSCQNIVLRWEPESQENRPAIVLGAHYDSWYGGAHDNCVAVQMMTDVFQKLSTLNLKHPIQAVYFDAEEVGLTGSRYHLEQRPEHGYGFYFNFEMPIPTQSGLLNTLFYSGHALSKRALQRRMFVKTSLIPISLKLFYAIFPAFPADLDCFHKQDIPSMSTFCHNPLAHTPLDNGENLLWKRYAAIRESIVQTICEVDRVL